MILSIIGIIRTIFVNFVFPKNNLFGIADKNIDFFQKKKKILIMKKRDHRV